MVRSKIDAVKFFEGEEKPVIIEALCSGCGICVKKCPFNVISIINLTSEPEVGTSHRYGLNMFKLYGIPIPQFGFVTGLIGKNGMGKTTALRILVGEIRPNLGNLEETPEWKDVLKYYRGSLLQEYFQRMGSGQLRTVLKPQYVDKIPKVVSDTVENLLSKFDERGKKTEIEERLDLDVIKNRSIEVLSGGELQRLAIGVAICRDADVYLFDEPSSFLDVKQRIEVAKAIRGLTDDGKAVIVAEHDLAILDYLSDFVCVLYGEPSVYGVISNPHGVRVGINQYLDGYLPDQNIRFRETTIKFHVKPPISTWKSSDTLLSWGDMSKSFDDFTLKVEPGEVKMGEVIGIVGPNGIGKTTFIKLLAGIEKPDNGKQDYFNLKVGYKPQYISTDYVGTIEDLLKSISKEIFNSSWYKTEIIQPLNLEKILDHEVLELSGGELQRVAIAVCLSKKADIYLLDEPSAYLDVEERLSMARTISRMVENRRVTAFVAEHDVATQDFLADRIMVFSGDPGIKGQANTPVSLRDGMNKFLKEMEITFRRDPVTGRPRVNKMGSRLDRYQKEAGEYYYTLDK
jgi:ATP-binding cassette subfamily E protein 1